METTKLTPPPFPTVTIHTSDGDMTIPCEPVGEHLAIIPGYRMLGDESGFEATLTGSFEVCLRSTGRPVTESGACIACARAYAKLLAETPVDWSKPEEEITAQLAGLPDEIRFDLSRGRDLSFGCDTEWCDQTGPGVVRIPVY